MNHACRILVTGAEGFTGRYLVAALAAQGHEVHGLVRALPPEPIPGAAALYAADLCDAAAVAGVVQAVGPQRVAHLAAIAHVAHGDVEQMYRTNVLGTRHLLHALTAAPHGLQAVLLASSANVYGNSTEGVLTEATPVSPANDYAVTKLALEHLAQVHAAQLPITVVRPFNYTGVGQHESFLLPKIVAHLRRRAPVIELGNLHVARDFSDVRRVVDAYARLLATPTALGQTFNVCAGQAYTLQEVLALAQALAGHTLDVRVNPSFVRANEVRRLLGSSQRLEACIGPLLPLSLNETLGWMLLAA